MAKPTSMSRKTAPKDAAKNAHSRETAVGQASRIRVLPSIGEIPTASWDACAGGTGANPFTRHAFLSALEASKSATARTGWQPQHLVAETADGNIIGVVPCYLKSHSRGEYVFDRGWAEAYEHAGGSYYPKLQVSVPFTPATGRRLMVAPGVDVDMTRASAASSGATTSNSTGRTADFPASRTSSRRWRRASARSSSASGAKASPTA